MANNKQIRESIQKAKTIFEITKETVKDQLIQALTPKLKNFMSNKVMAMNEAQDYQQQQNDDYIDDFNFEDDEEQVNLDQSIRKLEQMEDDEDDDQQQEDDKKLLKDSIDDDEEQTD